MDSPQAPALHADLPGEALDLVAYVAGEEWVDNLLHQIGTPYKRYGRLFLRPGPLLPAFWAENIWYEPRLIRFESLNNVTQQLKKWHPLWVPYGEMFTPELQQIARAVSSPPYTQNTFPFTLPGTAIGVFTLLDAHTLLASTRTLNPFIYSNPHFKENKKGPPSTAYLKIWEALTRIGKFPGPGSRCLDAGACPGGWTWVLDRLGAEVIALDRTPLDPRLMSRPTIRFRSGNAFAITPANIADFGWDRLDWLVSDLICYPEKLLKWVTLWLDSGKVDNFIITIKMQGSPDWETTAAFAAIPGSFIYHGTYNKNELTWVRPAPAQHGLS